MAKKQNLPSLVTTKDGKTSGVDTNVTLRNGSTGVNVKSLQNALITAGYDVGAAGADGIYGNATAAAVRKYQQDNGLAVDGIAGKDTLGLLYSGTKPTTATGFSYSASTKPVTTGGNAKPTANKTTTTGKVPAGGAKPSTGTPSNTPTTAPTNTPTNTPTTPAVERPVIEDFTYDSYTYDPLVVDPFQYSDTVKEAFAVIDQLKANKPGDWVDPYLDRRMGYLNQYENRGPFSYDFNSDALYNQYKDQYIQQGQMAMMDTMGQAAAMTGGYGNSYAQTVGQQAYNQQLSQLNNVMPELYQMAYNRYNQEGQDLLNMYDLYAGLSADDYGKYRDSVTDYYTNYGNAMDYATGLADRELNTWTANTNAMIDTWTSNNQLGLDAWAKETGMDLEEWAAKSGWDMDEYMNAINNEFTAGQNALDREQKAALDQVRHDEWQAEFDQDGQLAAYDKLAGLITTSGYTPSASELAAAGMTESEAKAYKNYYDSAASSSSTGGNGSTGGFEADNISSMSTAEILGTIRSYGNKGDDQGLSEFLDLCVLYGQMTEDMADEFYSTYKTQSGGPGGTEVDPTSYEGVRSSVLKMANGDGKWMEIDAALSKALQNGYITRAEWQKLRDEAAKTRQNYANGRLTQ
jgi:peptidoglycan hydrolase-like protein with peptidoglycan-binding domain